MSVDSSVYLVEEVLRLLLTNGLNQGFPDLELTSRISFHVHEFLEASVSGLQRFANLI